MAALNILRVIADGRCEQLGRQGRGAQWFANKRGRRLLAGRHPRITAGAIDDAALGVMTIGFRRAILLSEDGVYSASVGD